MALAIGGCTGAAGGGDGEIRNAGLIVHHQNAEPTSLDPARTEQGEKGEAFIDNVYERLLDVGTDGPDLIPSPATQVPTTPNGLVSESRPVHTFPLPEAAACTT